MDDVDFGAMVRREGPGVYAFLVYRTSDPDLAEELLADTFERAYRARMRFDRRRASQRTWLCAIALNRLRDVARSQASERSALERLAAEPGLSHHAGPAERVQQRRDVHLALGNIGSDEREALALVYGADLTAKQAARVLGVPTTTVQGRVFRGLEALREHLA